MGLSHCSRQMATLLQQTVECTLKQLVFAGTHSVFGLHTEIYTKLAL